MMMPSGLSRRSSAIQHEEIVIEREEFDLQSMVQTPKLEDFESKLFEITKVPDTASTTCQGSLLINPVIRPIPYPNKTSKNVNKNTFEEFNVTEKDFELTKHRFDHVSQNVQLASKIRL